MLPRTHIISGFIVSLILLFSFPNFITPFYALIIFLASFLIDFDHYLYYVFKQKDHSLKRAYQWFIEKSKFFKNLSLEKREQYKRGIIIFHGIECWIILMLLIFIHKIFLFVLIGIGIHMILDFIDLYRTQQPLHAKISQLYVHIANRTKKTI